MANKESSQFCRNTRSKSKTSEVKILQSNSLNTINNVTKIQDSGLSKEEDVKNCMIQDTNVFLMENIETLCVTCQKSLDHNSCSVFEKISITGRSDNSITIFKALQLFSNFGQLQIDLINLQICSTCLSSTKYAIYFQNQCNNSAEFLKTYLHLKEEVKIDIVENGIEGLQHKEKPEGIDLKDKEMSEENKSEPSEYRNETESEDSEMSEGSEYRNETESEDSEMSEGNESESDEKMSEDKESAEENSRRRKNAGKQRKKSPREICLCSWCGKQFPTISQLKQHNVAHTGERPCKCTICGIALRNGSHLKLHYMTHTNERPVVCPKCSKTFRNNSELNRHMVVHSGVKPFKCTACGKGFTQRYYIRMHEAKSCPRVRNKGIRTDDDDDDDES